MLDIVRSLLRTLRSTVQTHRALAVENLALRHQLMVLQRSTPGRAVLSPADRLLWVWLAGSWRAWRQALIWDRSKTHRGLAVATFLDVVESRQLLFPSYAPELNPVEYVWSYLKTKPLANLACPTVDVLATVGRRHARSLQRRPTLLRSFIRHSQLPLRLR